MRKMTFFGRVLPEIRKISTPNFNKIKMSDPRGFEANIQLDITDGRIRLDFEILLEIDNCMQFCAARAHEIATASVDIWAFSRGLSLSVIIDKVVEGTTITPIALSEQSVLRYGHIFNNDAEFLEIVAMVNQRIDLKFAFRDLISSLNTLNYSAIAACRAVEAIRGLIAPDETEARAWNTMRKLLRIDRTYLQEITDAARKPRHGSRGATDGSIQMIVTVRAWAVMNRYIQFMMRGGKMQLPANEFDILSNDE